LVGILLIECQDRMTEHAAVGFADHLRPFAAFRTFDRDGVRRHHPRPEIHAQTRDKGNGSDHKTDSGDDFSG